jgi:hypothetical protein
VNDTDRVMRRITEGRAARAAELAAAAAAPASGVDRLGAVHAPGARVFDPVTGQEGIVRGNTRQNVIVQPPRQ